MRHSTVADVMTTDVVSATPQDSFAHVAALLRSAEVRAVPSPVSSTPASTPRLRWRWPDGWTVSSTLWTS
jgi:hypothetical protein